jgi:hypothetical protein
MKVLLVSLAIGERYLNEYKKLFMSSQEKYAKKNGYDFKVITDFLDKTLQNRFTISFNKILVCSQDWSKNYDFIIFVDADIFININSPPIHNYIDYDNCIGIVDEYSQPTPSRRIEIQKKCNWETSATDYYKLCNFDLSTDIVLNSGVLVLQPKIHKNFLEEVYKKYVKFSINHKRGFIFEQTCLGYELEKYNMFKLIDNKFNALWSIQKMDNRENLTLEDFYNKNYFIHFAGHVDYDKVQILHKYL